MEVYWECRTWTAKRGDSERLIDDAVNPMTRFSVLQYYNITMSASWPYNPYIHPKTLL